MIHMISLIFMMMMSEMMRMMIKMRTNLIPRVGRAVVPVSTPCWVCVAPINHNHGGDNHDDDDDDHDDVYGTYQS